MSLSLLVVGCGFAGAVFTVGSAPRADAAETGQLSAGACTSDPGNDDRTVLYQLFYFNADGSDGNSANGSQVEAGGTIALAYRQGTNDGNWGADGNSPVRVTFPLSIDVGGTPIVLDDLGGAPTAGGARPASASGEEYGGQSGQFVASKDVSSGEVVFDLNSEPGPVTEGDEFAFTALAFYRIPVGHPGGVFVMPAFPPIWYVDNSVSYSIETCPEGPPSPLRFEIVPNAGSIVQSSANSSLSSSALVSQSLSSVAASGSANQSSASSSSASSSASISQSSSMLGSSASSDSSGASSSSSSVLSSSSSSSSSSSVSVSSLASSASASDSASIQSSSASASSQSSSASVSSQSSSDSASGQISSASASDVSSSSSADLSSSASSSLAQSQSASSTSEASSLASDLPGGNFEGTGPGTDDWGGILDPNGPPALTRTTTLVSSTLATVSTPVSAAAAPSVPVAELAFTGARARGLGLAGVAVTIAGALLLVVGRSRRHAQG